MLLVPTVKLIKSPPIKRQQTVITLQHGSRNPLFLNGELGISEGVKRWKLKKDVLFTEVLRAQTWAIEVVIVNLIALVQFVMGRLNIVKSLIP